MAKKQKQITWTKQSERRLEKAVKDFNKRIQNLKSKTKRGQRGYLPDEISFEGTRRLIKTQRELERVVKNLSEFKGKEAYKKVKLKSGKEITAWEKKKLERERKIAIRNLEKELQKEKKPEFRMRFARISKIKKFIGFYKRIYKFKR